MRPYAVFLPKAGDVPEFLDKAGKRFRIYSASVLSSGYAGMCAEVDGHKPPISSGFLVSLAVAESEANDAKVKEVAEAQGGLLLAPEVAASEWDRRFYPMRIKKIGPSVLVAEFYIPQQRFEACWESLKAKLPRDVLGLEAFAVRGGSMAVLVYVLDNAGDLLYPLRMGKAMIPLRIAQRLGGSIYTPGMWFATCSRKFFGHAKYDAVMRFKKRVDPNGLLNPGKIRGPGLPFLPMVNLSSLIFYGTALIESLSSRLPYKRSRAS
jgi:FAD/FMN-containing dehydrogenase